MSLFRGGQFDDAEDEHEGDEKRLQDEVDLRVAGLPRQPGASRLSATSRALGFSANQAALARAVSEGRTHSTEATAAQYLSMLSSADAAGPSPYYQRQSYRPYVPQQGAYSAIASSNEASIYARRAATAGTYGYPPGSNPEQPYANPYTVAQSSPHRDFGYYDRHELSQQAALLDRYNFHRDEVPSGKSSRVIEPWLYQSSKHSQNHSRQITKNSFITRRPWWQGPGPRRSWDTTGRSWVQRWPVVKAHTDCTC